MSAVALAPASVPRIPRRKDCDRADARETERQLLVRYHHEGDLAACEELVARFLPLARDLALRYTYTDEPFDDLLQVASLGGGADNPEGAASAGRRRVARRR